MGRSEQAPETMLSLMQKRETALQDKNWEAADQLRVQIENEGWEVKDTPHGPQLIRRS